MVRTVICQIPQKRLNNTYKHITGIILTWQFQWCKHHIIVLNISRVISYSHTAFAKINRFRDRISIASLHETKFWIGFRASSWKKSSQMMKWWCVSHFWILTAKYKYLNNLPKNEYFEIIPTAHHLIRWWATRIWIVFLRAHALRMWKNFTSDPNRWYKFWWEWIILCILV